ncbi:MAG: hypothetical protein NTW59_04105 [Candidatus Diapherotrites archaeon]|nr:hypothetical protein [Candidatus Diapherotrites archaeon]
MGRILLPAAFALLILASGCIQQQPPAGSADTALSECISICEAEKANGIDFSSGP